MSTIAIVGAGPGLGLSIARRFGKEGFTVALVSRSQGRLDDLVGQLEKDGITAAGFAADILDRPALTGALHRATERFGPVDVLEFSPAPKQADDPALTPVSALEVNVENIQQQIDYYVYGAVTAVQAVLPAMIERGSGTLLFTTGASSALVFPQMGNVGIASGALRNWVLALNATLADKGVYATHVPLATWIGQGGPETQPDTIAETYWDLYIKRDEAERLYSTL
ncbi:SDR family NAD(P)-dependent oxidoreductase [Candidatus Protofrankia californiensis]|uniref:SDR family NAD(P)-dependent oxidoreductase n=1 Tax=Candidatus Protofrankia californiensis TaxID=1839754 RepID=UPI0010415AFC|nr:SDR family NAD(P)-dependent oxidoreductase [Candidatus Protofrankia californiensis]